MNDRISQLILQAGTDVSGKWISRDQALVLAQLIVRECALLCSDPVVILQHWGLDSDAK